MFATVNGTIDECMCTIVQHAVGMSDDCFTATCRMCVCKLKNCSENITNKGKAKEQTIAEINVRLVYNYGVNFQCVLLLLMYVCVRFERKNAKRLWSIRRELYA